VQVEVLRVLETELIEAWKLEVSFLSTKSLEKYKVIDKEFARDARISPTELFVNLPDDWENMIQWTMTKPYQLT